MLQMATVPLPILALVAVITGGGQQVKQVDDALRIEFQNQKVNLETGNARYSGNVKATYGQTILHSDVLELSMTEGESRGLAEGHILLEDPDGTMTAEKLEFDWKGNTGEAKDVVIKSYRVTIRAKGLKIRPGNWTFMDVYATTCDRKLPVYQIHAPRIDVQPGRRAIIRNIELQVLGSDLIKIPYLRQSLDSRVTELAPPRMNFDEEGKASASWSNSFFASNNTVVGTTVKLADGLFPKYALAVTHSFIGTESYNGSFLPEAELNDTSKHSFFDSVTVSDPESEKRYLGKSRNSLTLGTFWNQRTPGRLVNNTINKPMEAIYQLGGGSEGFDVLGQVRFQNIGLVSEGTHERALASAAVSLPEFQLGRGLTTVARLSGSAYFNPGDEYSWGQAQFGLVYTPFKDVYLGGSYAVADEFGNPLFESDRPYSKSSMNLRFQWGLGPTKFAFLAKYDFNQNRWYDDELSLSQIMGCVEPYFVWRRFPNEISFGIGFRLDEFFDRLSKRQQVSKR